jgi:hypothetical protein
MEGWSRSRAGALTCLPIAKAAEPHAREDKRSKQEPTRRRLNLRNALPNARVDAGCKNATAKGEVFLDTLLYGRRIYPRFRRVFG